MLSDGVLLILISWALIFFSGKRTNLYVVMVYNVKCLKGELLDFFFPHLISGKGEGMAMKRTTISPHRPKGVAETLSFTIPGTQR